MNQLCLLPNEIQRKIQSYFYFSSETSKYMKIINNIIENYTSILMKEFTSIFYDRYNILYYRLITFLIANQDIKNHVEKKINPCMYEILYQTVDNDIVLSKIEDMMDKMTMIQKQKAYNYIIFGN